jgi:hypothetical protein
MFDGGAEWSVFTLSALRPPRFFEGVRGLGIMLLFFMSPLRVLRVIRLAIWNYLLDVGRRLMAVFRPSVYRPSDMLSPMAHIFTRVMFQEIITFGVQMDIYRGAPAIYLNNVVYDEVAHDVGPAHLEAFKAIRGIDRQVAQIDRMITRYGQGSYDLYILSDHGMSPSVPFKERFGLSLGDYILEQIGRPIVLHERWGSPAHALVQAQFLLDELGGLEERLSPRSAAVVRAVREYFGRGLPEDPDKKTPALATEFGRHSDDGRGRDQWDLERHSDVVVRVSGPLAHIYFNVSEQRLNLSEIALLYPALLNHLIDHPGIGLVAGREREETVMMSQSGTLTVNDATSRLQGDHPLDGLADPATQAARIDHLASFPRSGDLIVLGAWNNGTVVTFEDQIGTHGGLGGPQEKPFILYPSEIEWPSGTISNPCDLYPIFARYLDRRPDTTDRKTVDTALTSMPGQSDATSQSVGSESVGRSGEKPPSPHNA